MQNPGLIRQNGFILNEFPLLVPSRSEKAG